MPGEHQDIIVIVPPGTRVLYMHSEHTNGEVLVMNASLLMSAPIVDRNPLGSIGALTGVPVYDATQYTPDDDVGVVELGGAIGRHATTACRQGAHDLCTVSSCGCRCHE